MNKITSVPAFARPAFVEEGRRALQDLLSRQPDIREIDALLIDINGIPRGKRLPVAEASRLFEAGMQIPQSVYLMDPRGEMTNPFGRGIGDGDPDGTAWPIPSTIGAIWCDGPPRAQALMTLRDEGGASHPAEPRSALERVVERYTRSGLVAVAA